MGFKRTAEGRVFFSGSSASNDESSRRVSPQVDAPAQENTVPKPDAAGMTRGTQLQMLSLLKSLNEKLKLSHVERKSMRQELSAYKKHVEALQAKAVSQEQAYKDLQEKVKDAPDTKKAEAAAKAALKELEETRKLFLNIESKTELSDRKVNGLLEQAEQYKKVSLSLTQKQSELERGLSAQSETLRKGTENYQDILKRLLQTEGQQKHIEDRFSQTVDQHQALMQKLDKEVDDRARFVRKIEHMEQMMLSVENGIRAQKSIDKEAIEQGSGQHLPAYLQDDDQDSDVVQSLSTPMRVSPIAAMTAGVCLLLAGWAISAVQKPGFELGLPQVSFVSEAPQQTVPAQESQQPAALESWQVTEDAAPFVRASESDTAQDINAALQAPQGVPDTEEIRVMEQNFAAQTEEIATALNTIEPGNEQAPEFVAPKVEAETVEQVAAPQTPSIVTRPSAGRQVFTQADPSLPASLRDIEQSAFDGVPEAQHDLAAIYVTGYGDVTQNYARAAYWYDKASQGGVANASYNLGVLYHQGLGVEKDLDRAMSWYRSAADQGHPEAQYNLGIAHIEGVGVTYDPLAASLHFENAAANGVVEAAYNLGLIYENGLLGNAQPDKALMWYKQAADQGSDEARAALAQLARSLNLSMGEIDKIVETISAETSKAVASKETVTPVRINASASAPGNVQADGIISNQRTLINDIQSELIERGLYPGPTDGRIGPLTRDAIRAYQLEHGLTVDGQASAELLKHLEQNQI